MTTRPRVFITGANRGIGRATAAAVLDERDDTHVYLGSRSLERGEAARRELVADDESRAARVEVVEIDVTDDRSVARAAESMSRRLEKEGARLYGIVNNAGVGRSAGDMQKILDVNTRGPHRVCQALMPLLDRADGRIVNVSSASGPNFVAECSPERQALLTSDDVSWSDVEAVMHEALAIEAGDGDFASAGLGDGDAYGLSKALLNACTIALARTHPKLTVNACTPGFIETDLTRPYAEQRGVDPGEMGMKPPAEGTTAQIFLLFGDPGGSGWYFGSDAKRSPLDRYRSPGDPPYTGD